MHDMRGAYTDTGSTRGSLRRPAISTTSLLRVASMNFARSRIGSTKALAVRALAQRAQEFARGEPDDAAFALQRLLH